MEVVSIVPRYYSLVLMSKYISASNVYCFCSLVTSEKVKLSNIVDDNLPHYHKEGDQYYIVIVTKKARKKKERSSDCSLQCCFTLRAKTRGFEYVGDFLVKVLTE